MKINKYLRIDTSDIENAESIEASKENTVEKIDETIYLWIKDLYASNFELFQIEQIISTTFEAIEKKIYEERKNVISLDRSINKTHSINLCGFYTMLLSGLLNNCGDLQILVDYELRPFCKWLGIKYPNEYLEGEYKDYKNSEFEELREYTDDFCEILLEGIYISNKNLKLNLSRSVTNFMSAHFCFGEFIDNYKKVKYEPAKMERH